MLIYYQRLFYYDRRNLFHCRNGLRSGIFCLLCTTPLLRPSTCSWCCNSCPPARLRCRWPRVFYWQQQRRSPRIHWHGLGRIYWPHKLRSCSPFDSCTAWALSLLVQQWSDLALQKTEITNIKAPWSKSTWSMSSSTCCNNQNNMVISSFCIHTQTLHAFLAIHVGFDVIVVILPRTVGLVPSPDYSGSLNLSWFEFFPNKYTKYDHNHHLCRQQIFFFQFLSLHFSTNASKKTLFCRWDDVDWFE